jgi:hypothetical protein
MIPTVLPMMIAIVMMMMMMCTMCTIVTGAAICGTEFQPCRTDRDPGDTTISIEDCCEGFTCLPTQEYHPPFTLEENIWPGLCLGERSLKLALLPTELKEYMIINTYITDKGTWTRDHKLPHQSLYVARLHMEQGDFPQLVYRIEDKFNVKVEIPDSIPDDFELPEME